MQGRKRPAPAEPAQPTPPLEVSVARLQERVDGFQTTTFPMFCKSLDDRIKGFDGRLGAIDDKLEKVVLKNGEFDKVKKMAEEWAASNLRREGAVGLFKISWRVLACCAGLAGAAGVSGSGFLWLLGRITGHI